MNMPKDDHLKEQDPEAVRTRELRALAELIRVNDLLMERIGVFRQDLINEVRDEREQDIERVKRGDV